MSRFRRLAGGACAAVAWWAVSCRDVPAPEGGVHSISTLIRPLPGVVAGDTLRDTLGLAAPLDVIAYGADNEPLDPQPEKSFVVLDTGARLVDGRFLVGDTPGTKVRIVGTVGSLQTRPETVKVTLAPDTLVPLDSILHRVFYSIPPDTTAQTTLNVAVRNRPAAAGVEAVIVRFSVDRAPASVDTAPSVLLLNGNSVSLRDTTDASGRASRVARLRLTALGTYGSDTVLVSAVAAYRGVPVGVVQFTIIYQRTTPGAARINH